MIITGIDIETTGLEQAKGHRIIEVAAALYDFTDIDNYSLKGSWVHRINPQRSIDPGAQRVHKISFEDVAMEKTWEQVAPNLVRVLKASDTLIAHNGNGFDLPFISMELVRVGIAPPSIPSVDTCTEARWATPNGKYPKLQELCFATGVPYDPSKAHAALYDVQVMMEAFFVGLRKGFFKLPSIPAKEKEVAVVS